MVSTLLADENRGHRYLFLVCLTSRDFCGDDNDLQFWFQLKGSGAQPDAASNSVTFQEGKVVFEDKVMIDDSEVDVKDINIDGVDVKIRFPHFNELLWYDPTVTSDDGGDGNGAISLATASSVLPITITCLAGMLLVFF
eukprot:gb/GECG01016010.1/.p1 GENE.gb/GECG01016010.1/~~gb/GECG01016010.1/.p1  ORF type:complete len:139 (+),score=15.80 gb/GECG01016010.1/:1-417(+)